MDNYLQEALNRARTLLKAAGTLLKKQEDSNYVLNLLAETVYYDEAECDGSCLLDDIRYWFDEFTDENIDKENEWYSRYAVTMKQVFQEDNYMNKENLGDYRIDYSKDNPVLYEMYINEEDENEPYDRNEDYEPHHEGLYKVGYQILNTIPLSKGEMEKDSRPFSQVINWDFTKFY